MRHQRQVCSQLLLWAAAILAAGPALAPERDALLVGLNQYSHPKLRDPPLKFAVNDATEMADVLEKAGYKVTLLTDEAGRKNAKAAPTKANIVRQLTDVLRRTKPGDTVVVGL